ncbi:MAG: hypothetical protein WCM76_03130 [Bacteroidota bacterium]
MKKTILLLTALVFTAISANAQEAKVKHHDIRIMVNNIANRSQNDFFEYLFYYDWMDDDYAYYDLPSSFFNKKNYGIGYRYRFGNNALRFNIGFNYTTQKNVRNSTSLTSGGLTKYKNTLMDMFTSVGYQRDFVFDKCHIYVGVDAKYNYMTYDEDYTTTNNAYPTDYTIDYGVNNYTTGIGGGPFVGAEYFIVPALSVSIETGCDYFHEVVGSKYKRNPSNAASDESSREDVKQNFKFNPLSTISVNVHF